jgi:hypothetical protein
LRRSSSSTRTQIALEWSVEPPTDTPITGYSVEADLTGEGEFIEIWNGRGRADVLSYTLSVTTGQVYSFRHRSFNANGASPYSNVFTTYACEMPSAPSKPQWITSTTTTITFIWEDPIDNGGCPIKEYKVFRDDGNSGSVVNEIHQSELENKPYVNGLIAN